MKDEIPDSLQTSRPVPISIPSLVSASSPPVTSQLHQPIVLEEHELAPDKGKLQLGLDLHQQSFILWGLTEIASFLPGNLWRAVEIEAT